MSKNHNNFNYHLRISWPRPVRNFFKINIKRPLCCFLTNIKFDLKIFLVILAVSISNSALGNSIELSGLWQGTYYYKNNNRAPVKFTMQIKTDGESILGSTTERAELKRGIVADAYANITGTMKENSISFIKKYDGRGGISHSVKYSGDINAAGNEIKGVWRIGFSKGSFILKRESTNQSHDNGATEDTAPLGITKTIIGSYKGECVHYAREHVDSLPTGLFTYSDKLNIINSSMPQVGSVAIIGFNTGKYIDVGHVAVVESITSQSITIIEANYTAGKITRRVSTGKNLEDAMHRLNIKGFYRKTQH